MVDLSSLCASPDDFCVLLQQLVWSTFVRSKTEQPFKRHDFPLSRAWITLAGDRINCGCQITSSVRAYIMQRLNSGNGSSRLRFANGLRGPLELFIEPPAGKRTYEVVLSNNGRTYANEDWCDYNFEVKRWRPELKTQSKRSKTASRKLPDLVLNLHFKVV
ncbi:hypothetical protein EON65_44405 [archaeon]|nr:MAG: hypothetical protein EON65_44405 [archaeon]